MGARSGVRGSRLLLDPSQLFWLPCLGHSQSRLGRGKPGSLIEAQHGAAVAIQPNTWHRQSLNHTLPLANGRSTVDHPIWSDRILHLQVSASQYRGHIYLLAAIVSQF